MKSAFTTAKVFTDDLGQSISRGECQTAVKAGILNANKIIELGHVIDGLHPGRESENEITIFDGTGIYLLARYLSRKMSPGYCN